MTGERLADGSRSSTIEAARVIPGAGGALIPGLESVVEAFFASVDTARSGGALSVWLDGSEVIDIWCGTADRRTRTPWCADTLSVLFSISKGLAAILIARLASRGVLDLESAIGDILPEFATYGKGEVSIGEMLAHRAGVAAPRSDLTLDEVLDRVRWRESVAAQKPLWKPGAGYAYHAHTLGLLVEEIVQRATGEEFHAVWQRQIASPLSADITFRATAQELARVARLDVEQGSPELEEASAETNWSERALTLGAAFPATLVDGDAGFNDPRVQAAGLVGAGGLGTATGAARIWSAAVTSTLGVRLIDDDALGRLIACRSEGPSVFGPAASRQRWGAGVQLATDEVPWFSPDSFGHEGAGGQVSIADPHRKVALTYVRNEMVQGRPATDVVDALLRVL